MIRKLPMLARIEKICTREKRSEYGNETNVVLLYLLASKVVALLNSRTTSCIHRAVNNDAEFISQISSLCEKDLCWVFLDSSVFSQNDSLLLWDFQK